MKLVCLYSLEHTDAEAVVQHNNHGVSTTKDIQSAGKHERSIDFEISPATSPGQVTSDEENIEQKELALSHRVIDGGHSDITNSHTDDGGGITDMQHVTSTPKEDEDVHKPEETIIVTNANQQEDNKLSINFESKTTTDSNTVPKLVPAVSFDDPSPTVSYLDMTENEEFETRPRTLSLLSEKSTDLRSPIRPDSVYSSSDEYEAQTYEHRKNLMIPLHSKCLSLQLFMTNH